MDKKLSLMKDYSIVKKKYLKIEDIRPSYVEIEIVKSNGYKNSITIDYNEYIDDMDGLDILIGFVLDLMYKENFNTYEEYLLFNDYEDTFKNRRQYNHFMYYINDLKEKILTVDDINKIYEYMFNDVAFIYPITPSSPMAENVDVWANEKKENVFGNANAAGG